jgi:hypothetical protein
MTKYDLLYYIAVTWTIVFWVAVVACILMLIYLIDVRSHIGWILFEIFVGILLLFVAVSLAYSLDDIDEKRDEKNFQQQFERYHRDRQCRWTYELSGDGTIKRVPPPEFC